MGKKDEDDSSVSSVEIDDEKEEAHEETEEEGNDLTRDEIVTKYRTAGDIANRTLAAVMAAVAPGKLPVELCQLGDGLIEEATNKIYNQKKDGKKIEKGIAFPTCVSVNNCVGHYSPLVSEDKVPLAEGDLLKIDLGVHVDGYIAVVAHTVLCGGGALDGRKADVVQAAWTAAELAQRMLKDGATNHAITKMIGTVADTYKVNAIEGVLSHQMKKYVIDASKTIVNRENPEQKIKEETLNKNDVFAIDIMMSTGEGRPKPSDCRTTVFKRNVEEKYSLKMKASRSFFSEVNSRFPTMPFTLRAGDEKAWRLGITECMKHDLFTDYPVLYERPDEFVAVYKFTALLMPSGKTARITSGPAPVAPSSFSLEDPELLEVMSISTEPKKKNKPKKKKAAADAN